VFSVAQASSPVKTQTGDLSTRKNAASPLRSPGSALPFWSGSERDAKFDACDLKGSWRIFRAIRSARDDVHAPSGKHRAVLESAVILQGKNQVGEFGQFRRCWRKNMICATPCCCGIESGPAAGAAESAKSFKPCPRFRHSPDVAMIVPEATTHDAVLQVVKQTKPANLEAVELFDVFRGKNVPDGQKSVAYAFTYRAATKR